jgi:branched-chain amino acid transport system substrate-binding protein
LWRPPAAKSSGLSCIRFPRPRISRYSWKAQASGAKILGICGAGSDLINCIKQAHEFGLTRTMKLAAMVAYSNDMHAIGIEMAAGTSAPRLPGRRSGRQRPTSARW